MQGKSEFLQKSATAIGVGTPILLNGAFASISVQVWGPFVGTVVFEVTLNGVDWVPAIGQINSTTTPGVFYFTVNGVMRFRSNVTAYTSGSINAIANSLEESMGDSGTTVLTGSNATDGQTLWTPGMLYNEATSDKPRGNTQGTLLASAARTSSTISPTQTNYNANSATFFLNITAASGTGGLSLRIEIIDPVSGAVYQANVSPAAIVAVGQYGYQIGAGVTGASTGNGYIQQATPNKLPRIFRVTIVHGDVSSYTYSLGYSLNVN